MIVGAFMFEGSDQIILLSQKQEEQPTNTISLTSMYLRLGRITYLQKIQDINTSIN